MLNNTYIQDLINEIFNINTLNKSELVGYLRDLAYSKSIDNIQMLYIIDSLYPILMKKLDLTIPDNNSLQDEILDLYSIFSLEQGYYEEYIYTKVSQLNRDILPFACQDFIDGIIEAYKDKY